MRPGLVIVALAATSCGLFAGPPRTSVDKDGMFVVECPYDADGCLRAAAEHCPQYGYLLDGAVLVTRPTESVARHAAESGRMRLRCESSATGTGP